MEIQLDKFVTPFDLEHTLRCGQSFRWGKHGGWWYGVVKNKVVKIRRANTGLEFEGASVDFVENYFRLDDNLPAILHQISKDDCIKRAVQMFQGLRILRQEPWECLISYICSTYKNIPAIKDMVQRLSKQFGERRIVNGYTFYTFPKPEDLADADVKQLKVCKLGFRAKHVLETTKNVYDGEFSLEALKKMSYENAKQELLTLPGVGQKVADCVLLFSLDKLEAFPVDVWVKRVTMKYYSHHFEPRFVEKVSNKKAITPLEYRKINSFGRTHFGKYAGYAQEYLFAYTRLTTC
ncbi:MAG: DNA glycosylase [Thermoproteota archaeon]|nr:DNA glycosylase [Thermoproteota archaeon]